MNTDALAQADLPVPARAIAWFDERTTGLLDGTIYDGHPTDSEGWVRAIATPVVIAEIRRLAEEIFYNNPGMPGASLLQDLLCRRADELDAASLDEDTPIAVPRAMLRAWANRLDHAKAGRDAEDAAGEVVQGMRNTLDRAWAIQQEGDR